MIQMWNQLRGICMPEKSVGLKPLPFSVAYAVACCTEAIGSLLGASPSRAPRCGRLTRSSLGFATTPISLQLGYIPRIHTAVYHGAILSRHSGQVVAQKPLKMAR